MIINSPNFYNKKILKSPMIPIQTCTSFLLKKKTCYFYPGIEFSLNSHLDCKTKVHSIRNYI